MVMDSAPSGPVFDPAGAVSRGGAIVEGWLVAPVDLGLPTAGPTARTHRLVRWLVCSSPRRQRDRWFVSTGQWRWPAGGSKERYFTGEGTFSGPGRGYQLTLVQAESLDEVDLSWEEARRNVVTRA